MSKPNDTVLASLSVAPMLLEALANLRADKEQKRTARVHFSVPIEKRGMLSDLPQEFGEFYDVIKGAPFDAEVDAGAYEETDIDLEFFDLPNAKAGPTLLLRTVGLVDFWMKRQDGAGIRLGFSVDLELDGVTGPWLTSRIGDELFWRARLGQGKLELPAGEENTVTQTALPAPGGPIVPEKQVRVRERKRARRPAPTARASTSRTRA